MNMLVVTGGRERTAHEYEALFQASGFTLARTAQLARGLAVLEATPV